MAKLIISKRLAFLRKGQQRKFIADCQQKINLSSQKLVEILGVHQRTLADWKREKFLISSRAAKLLSRKSGVRIPKTSSLLDAYWYTKIGARKGGVAVYKKYGKVGGNPLKRKKAWKKWWQEIGKFKKRSIFKRKPIKTPEKKNRVLAEFVGIMMGDGGMSKRQLFITLHSVDDLPYSFFVARMIKKLFGIKAAIYVRKSSRALDLVVSRTELVDFCKSLGLKIGDKLKQNLDIPRWIKNDKNLLIACVRGLMDTDGGVINHCYQVKGKHYCYKKLSFSSASPALLKSMYNILKKFNFSPRIDYSNKSVRIENSAQVKKYFEIVKSNNSKNLRRYQD